MVLVKAVFLAAAVAAAPSPVVEHTDDKRAPTRRWAHLLDNLSKRGDDHNSTPRRRWNKWATIGTVVAGVCALLLVILLATCLVRRRLGRRKEERRQSHRSFSAVEVPEKDMSTIGHGTERKGGIRAFMDTLSMGSTRSSRSAASEASTAMPEDFRGTPVARNAALPTIYQAPEGVPSRYSFGAPETVTNNKRFSAIAATPTTPSTFTNSTVTTATVSSSSLQMPELLASVTPAAAPTPVATTTLRILDIPTTSMPDPQYPRPMSQVSPLFCSTSIPSPGTPPRAPSSGAKSAVTPTSAFTSGLLGQHGRDESVSSTASSVSMPLSMVPAPADSLEVPHPASSSPAPSVSTLQPRSPQLSMTRSLSMKRSQSLTRKAAPPPLRPSSQLTVTRLEPAMVSPLSPLNFPHVPPRTLRTPSLTRPIGVQSIPAPAPNSMPDSPTSLHSLNSTEESSSIYASASPSPTPSMARLSSMLEIHGLQQGLQKLYKTTTPTTSFPAHTVEHLQDD